MGLLRKKESNIDMLNGNLNKDLFRFALPLAATSLLQMLFNSADVAIVGKFAGDSALAAVGANTPIITLLVNLFVGMSVGANVVIAKFLGMKNEKNANVAAHTAVVIAFLSGIILLVIGELFAGQIAQIMCVADEIKDMTVLYMRVYFIGMPVIMLYNFAAAIFRSKGETRLPLVVLTIAGLINVGLNFFFVLVLKMTVDGVALGTVISNAISAIVLLYVLFRKEDVLKLSFRKMKINKVICLQIMKVGIPSGLQGAVFSVSNIFVQSSVNSLGTIATAANTTGLYFQMFSYSFANAFGQAAITFSGQNFGAGNYERCRVVTRKCLLFGIATSWFLGIIFSVFPTFFGSIYTDSAETLALIAKQMKIVVFFEFLNCTDDVISGVLRVYGKVIVPTLVYIVSICGTRILWVNTVFLIPSMHNFPGVSMTYPVSWIITNIAILIAYFIVIKKMPEMKRKDKKLLNAG